MVKGTTRRTAEYPINPLFIDRWSPRAMTGEPIGYEELMVLFEAARWAPSAYNNQPWRILFARRDSSWWSAFFDLLTDSNKVWAGSAACLLLFMSKTSFDHNGAPSRTHSFDTGAAWQNLALQGYLMGLVVHGMQGFDDQRARRDLGIPEGYAVEIMAAVGRPGDPSSVLPEFLRKVEFPKTRRPLSGTICEGEWSCSVLS